jgi:hypothetical protein
MVWKQELSQEPSKGRGHRSPDSPERARSTAATGPVWMLAVSLGRCDKAFVQTMVKEPAVIPSAIAVRASTERLDRNSMHACAQMGSRIGRSIAPAPSTLSIAVRSPGACDSGRRIGFSAQRSGTWRRTVAKARYQRARRTLTHLLRFYVKHFVAFGRCDRSRLSIAKPCR